MTLAIRPLHATLAGEIAGISLASPIQEAELARIVAAWQRHAVLVFRNQDLSPEAQLAFSRRLGALDPAPAFDVKRSTLDGHAEIAVVSNITRDGEPIGGLGHGDLAWHSDMTFVPSPPVACLLHARELPEAGGDTFFLDLRAAWASLPRTLAEQARRLRILHDRAYTSAGTKRLGAESGEGTWHPARVIDPLSGEAALFLGRRRNSRLHSGDASVDAEALLDALWAQAGSPAHIYRHVWSPGDVVLWNNVTTMHRRDAFENNARRLLHRTQIRRLHPHWETVAWQLAS